MGVERWGGRKEDFGVGGGTEGFLCVWKTVGQKTQLRSISVYGSMLADTEPKTRLKKEEKGKQEKQDIVVVTVVCIRFPNIRGGTNSPGLICP